MIFPTAKKLKKGKSVQAVADFFATEQAVGKIVAKDASNVKNCNGIAYAGGFVQTDKDVLQYLPPHGTEKVMLKADSLVMGIRTFYQFRGFLKAVYGLDERSNTVVASGNNVTYEINSGNVYKLIDEQYDSFAYCQSRWFALSGRRVYVTDPTELDLKNARWIDLPAPCHTLISNGELFAIGKQVYKLHPDGDESHFVVKQLSANVGNVVSQTVCAYGNRIMFVADGRIFSLQNSTIKVVAQTDVLPTCATIHRGLYYLFGKKDGTNVALAYNPHSGKVVCIHHVNAQNVISDDYNLFVSDGKNGYQLMEEQTSCFWQSQPIDFDGKLTVKHLHRLLIQTATDVEVHVLSDTRRIYHLKGKNELQSLLIVGHGKNITVELHSRDGKMDVKRLCITARPSEVCL